MADVDFGDMFDYLAANPHTRAILLYVEGITHGRKFMSAARAASRIKPVLVLKAGRSNAGARAATSHTGVLAGADAVYDAVFRRAVEQDDVHVFCREDDVADEVVRFFERAYRVFTPTWAPGLS